jgi:DNA modification methylase
MKARKGPGWGSSMLSAVVELPLGRLRPWPENPRTIAPGPLADLKRSMAADREMLSARPLLALPDGTVIAGNQRLRAAQELGWETIAVLRVDLEWRRAREWALRDNNQFGDWDERALADLLAELKAEGSDLGLSGFSSSELDRILADLPGVDDPDDAPALATGEPLSRPGELYELGTHRLLCGDATDPDQLALLLGGGQAEVLWTDPPYGVDYVGKNADALTIRNDTADGLPALLAAAFAAIDTVLVPSGRFYVCAPAGPRGTDFRLAIRDVGWHLHQVLCWAKHSPVLGHSDYHFAHEDVLYGYKPGPGRPGRGRHQGSRWFGGNDQSSVLHVDRPSKSELHPTIKPIGLIEPMLRNSSRRGEIILDPFAGSGSTLIACERLGRRCFAAEIDPAYADVIRRRYEELVGG